MDLRRKSENPSQRADTARPAHGDVDSGQAPHHRLGRFRFTRFGFGLSEQRSAQGELSSPCPIGEHSGVAQPGEAAREYMQEESADELAGIEAHQLDLVAVGVVAPSKPNVLAVEVDDGRLTERG